MYPPKDYYSKYCNDNDTSITLDFYFQLKLERFLRKKHSCGLLFAKMGYTFSYLL